MCIEYSKKDILTEATPPAALKVGSGIISQQEQDLNEFKR